MLNCEVFSITFFGMIDNKDIIKKIYGTEKECMKEFKEFINSIYTKVNNKKSRPKGSIIVFNMFN